MKRTIGKEVQQKNRRTWRVIREPRDTFCRGGRAEGALFNLLVPRFRPFVKIETLERLEIVVLNGSLRILIF